jgi:hypothetical protein
VGTPNDITEHFTLMFDLMALAFQADITRVITFSMDREASMRTYTNLGIAEGFHPLSHHGNNPDKQSKLVLIQRYHTEVFAKFLTKLSQMPDGDGSMLDHSILLYGSNMSNSNAHNQYPLPTTVIGGACGKLRGGQHINFPARTPLANVLLTMLQRSGVQIEIVADDHAVANAEAGLQTIGLRLHAIQNAAGLAEDRSALLVGVSLTEQLLEHRTRIAFLWQ